MSKKIISMLLLTLSLVLLLAVSGVTRTRIKDVRSEKLYHYGFQVIKKARAISGNEMVISKGEVRQSLGITTDGNSPGELIAHTWYEYQQNSTMGRLIDWRAPEPQIHMAYTQMFGSPTGPRTLSYNVFDPVTGSWPLTGDIGCAVSPLTNARGGFANTDADPSGAAVITGHIRLSDNVSAPTRTTVYWDATAPVGVYCGFGSGSRISDSLNNVHALESGTDVIFPKLEYHIRGSDTVVYAFCCEFATGDQHALVLFRKEGNSAGGSTGWTATFIEDCWWMCQDITASRVSSKVALVWLEDAAEGILGQSDVWYWVSHDMGLTWNPANKHNITNYDPDLPGYRAWMEVSCLYDTQDHLHVLWNANVYDGDRTDSQTRRCRLFHWADHTDIISTVKNAEWDPLLNCGVGGANVHNLAKFTISECNGKLYAIWIQFGDPENGDTTDCANPEFVNAAFNANAEIYLSVSTDLNGDKWDEARNLTCTKTPGCDNTPGNECDNENWPSMSRYGMNNASFTGLDWSAVPQAHSVDPSRQPDSPYTGTYYLDVMYVNDLVPGASTGADATPAANVPLKWFRLPCVEPVIEAKIALTPDQIVYPEYTSHGTPAFYHIRIENNGNADLNISKIGAVKTTLPGVNWLTVNTTSLLVPAGSNNVDTVVVTLNNGGVINNPGTVVNLKGQVFFEWHRQTLLDTVYLPIDFYVADTVVGIIRDTISTRWISLVVSSNGNMGKSNAGRVNMDFYDKIFECDNILPDTIPGDASVYLGNASPVILTADLSGSDTIVTASWAIFKENLNEPNGFKPVTGFTPGGVRLSRPTHYEDAVFKYEAFHTGSFVTTDSSLVVEKTYYARSLDAAYIVQMMRLFSFDGDPHTGLVIGEAFDWDIPSDSGSYNSTGSDPVNDLIYIRGGEWDEPHGDSLECQDNDERFGGAIRIGYYSQAEFNTNPVIAHTEPIWGGYAEYNEDYVYPAGGFVPLELYRNMMNNPGLNAQPSSVQEDQHIVLTYLNNYNLSASDTLIIWTVMATVQFAAGEGAVSLVNELKNGKNWLVANINNLKKEFAGCCIGVTGDIDCSGGDPDISDISRLIDHLYLSHKELCCLEEADVDGSGGAPDISDISYLIAHLYIDHRILPDCP